MVLRSIKQFTQLALRYPWLIGFTILLLAIEAVLTGLSVISIAPVADIVLGHVGDDSTEITKWIMTVFNGLDLEFNLITASALAFLVLVALNAMTVFVRWSTLKMRASVVKGLTIDSMQVIYRSTWTYFANTTKGDLINTYANEVNNAGNAFQALALIVANVVRIFSFLVVPIFIAPYLVVICILGTVSVMVPFTLLGKWSYRYGRGYVSAANRYTSLLKEFLEGAREIIAFGQVKKAIGTIGETYDDYANTRVRSATFGYSASQMYEPAGFLVVLVVLGAAHSQNIHITSMAVVLWGIVRTMSPLKQILHLKHQLDNSLPSLEQIQSQQREAARYSRRDGSGSLSATPHQITFDNVYFGYDDKKCVVNGASFEIAAGERIVIAGESGSGKSTIIDLLLGLQLPDRGVVKIGGVDIKQINSPEWREQIGVVVQKSILFDMTIGDNLKWLKPNAEEDELWSVLRVVEAAGFVSTLPSGLQTEIGEAGMRLSGGQSQRLSIARAILRKPKLLVLDEATSALDVETEARVLDSVLEYLVDSTIILVTHRPQLYSKADRVIYFQNGYPVDETNSSLRTGRLETGA